MVSGSSARAWGAADGHVQYADDLARREVGTHRAFLLGAACEFFEERVGLGDGTGHLRVRLSYDRPARHTREYLGALLPLLRGEQVDHRGETLRATGKVEVPGAAPPPVLLSALGPVMLRIAGELADGTVTVWATPETVAGHIKPRVDAAAAAAGRPAPRIVTGVLASVTADPGRVRQQVAERVGAASGLPSYRALLDRQGQTGVHETVLAGGEDAVADGIRAYAAAGATDILVSAVGDTEEQARTLKLLSAVRRTG